MLSPFTVVHSTKLYPVFAISPVISYFSSYVPLVGATATLASPPLSTYVMLYVLACHIANNSTLPLFSVVRLSLAAFVAPKSYVFSAFVSPHPIKLYPTLLNPSPSESTTDSSKIAAVEATTPLPLFALYVIVYPFAAISAVSSTSASVTYAYSSVSSAPSSLAPLFHATKWYPAAIVPVIVISLSKSTVYSDPATTSVTPAPFTAIVIFSVFAVGSTTKLSVCDFAAHSAYNVTLSTVSLTLAAVTSVPFPSTHFTNVYPTLSGTSELRLTAPLVTLVSSVA